LQKSVTAKGSSKIKVMICTEGETVVDSGARKGRHCWQQSGFGRRDWRLRTASSGICFADAWERTRDFEQELVLHLGFHACIGHCRFDASTSPQFRPEVKGKSATACAKSTAFCPFYLSPNISKVLRSIEHATLKEIMTAIDIHVKRQLVLTRSHVLSAGSNGLQQIAWYTDVHKW